MKTSRVPKTKSKSSGTKKSQGTIIAIIIIILLCLITVVILWRVVFPMTQNTNDETKIRQELSKTRISVNDVSGNLAFPVDDKIDITLSRNEGKINFLNLSVKTRTINRTVLRTIQKPVNNTINITTLKNVTHLVNITRTVNVTRTINTTINRLVNASIVSVIDISGSMGDRYLGKKKLQYAKEANIQFIDNIFNRNPDNNMGVAAYQSDVYPNSCYPYACWSLTKDRAGLISKVNSYRDGGNTNMCRGLIVAINMLNSIPSVLKVMVLMSDGNANIRCDGTYDRSRNKINAKNDAIAQASIAKDNNIKIYTIGFGTDADAATLRTIAKTTGGTYSFADATSLTAIYDQISSQINITINITVPENITVQENITTLENVTETIINITYINVPGYVNETINETITETVYEPVQIWQNLKIVIQNDSTTFVYDNITGKDIINPLETKTYTIPTGGIVNINKIDIYLIVKTEDGKEISELVASWTPNSEPEYLPSY